MSISPRLARRPSPSGDQGFRFGLMDEMSGELSEKRSGFPNVIQHDLPLTPAECGGPVVDLKGNVLGINIARAGRIKSFAIPARDIEALLALSGDQMDSLEAQAATKATPPPVSTPEARSAAGAASKSAADLEKDFDEALRVVEEAREALKKATDALRREKLQQP